MRKAHPWPSGRLPLPESTTQSRSESQRQAGVDTPERPQRGLEQSNRTACHSNHPNRGLDPKVKVCVTHVGIQHQADAVCATQTTVGGMSRSLLFELRFLFRLRRVDLFK